MRAFTWAALLVAAGLLVTGTEARLAVIEKDRVPGHHLLYLPSGKYLRIASLGNAPVAADILYLWSIQYYGNFQIEDRYQYVDHIYSDVITELDPKYFDPYWLGALILSVEKKDLEKAVGLLEKGFRNNPDRWIFLYLAGWECAYARQYDRAAQYFRRAAEVKGVPPDVIRLVAGMHQKAGDANTALAEWTRVARDTTDPGVKKIAENRVRSLRTEVGVQTLQGAIERYRSARGAFPKRLSDIVRAGILSVVPLTPDGEEYAYDRTAGTVAAGAQGVIPR